MSKLFEYQIDDNIKRKELIQKVIQKLSLTSFDDIDPKKVKEFIDDNYDLLITDIDTISSNILLRNYIDYIQKNQFVESINKTLKEADIIKSEIKILINKK